MRNERPLSRTALLETETGSARELTAEEKDLARQIAIATTVLWVCAFLVAIPVIATIWAFFFLPPIPESAFLGMAIMFYVIKSAPFFMIPLFGVGYALYVKAHASARLRRLRTTDDRGV